VIACISGGTSGIGAEVTAQLLARGDEVFVVGRTTEQARQFEERVDSASGHLTILTGDLREAAFADEIATRIEKSAGRLDLLVNGAGTISGGGLTAETLDVWQRVMTTNLDTAFNLTKACVELLTAARGAAVVNISSVCSLRPCASLSYSVSKAGLDMFTRATARDLAPRKIRVNAVNPSVVRTNLQKSAGLFADDATYESWIDDMEPMHPLGRVGEPNDIAAAILFLGDSKQCGWTTGAILSVDGGRGVA
jgi:NAD(P)-dependent dehydrogenase (short-subunit alcohol dehydrogenase family)